MEIENIKIKSDERFINDLEKAKRPDKLLVLLRWKDKISKSEYSLLLRYWWINTEFPNQYPNDILINMFKDADRKILFDGFEEEFEALGDLVRVYRGVQDCVIGDIGKMDILTLSWTTDIKKARWFANRWRRDGNGKLYSGLIPKHHIFMYNDGREEREMVINPYKIKNITELK